jgi:signal peptidase II
MRSVPANRWAIFLLLAAVGCATDLATKRWIFDELGMPASFGEQPNVIRIVGDIFRLETTLNEGALFGLGQGKTAWFAGLSIVAVAGVFYWLFVAGAARDLLLTVALGLVTGGVFGNLYDRLGLPGLRWHEPDRLGTPVYAVRDWLHFQVQAWNFNWPVFNIADSLLVVGAALLVLQAFRDGKKSPATSTATDE